MTNNGSGIGSFTSNLNGLSPGTTYYVRAYATNSGGTAYGIQRQFTSLALPPTVSTNAITNITATSAVSGGNVTSDGGAAVTARGTVWSTSQNPTISNNTGITNNGSGSGSFIGNLTSLTSNTTYYVIAYATNNAGTSYGNLLSFETANPCADVIPPAGYGVVSSSGKCWLDRNLGAIRVAQSSTDAYSYGDLYQWGRLTDGHENRTSATTTSTSGNDIPGHAEFVLNSLDWRSPQNDNLWQGPNGINNPCPPSYRLPTETEWEAERQSWSNINAVGAFNSPLKLPVNGYRSSGMGKIFGVGTDGSYWSMTVISTNSRSLNFSASGANMGSNSRAAGVAVRCIKD